MHNMFIRLVDCSSPHNPVLLVNDNGDSFFYGVPTLEVLEKHSVAKIVVNSPSMDTAMVLRRIALLGNPEKITVVVSSSSPLRNTVNVLGFSVNEYFYEARISRSTRLVWIGCGSMLVSEEKRLVATPPCSPEYLVEAIERTIQGFRKPRIIFSPIGSAQDLYVKRLIFYDPDFIAIPECVAQNRLTLEATGAMILSVGEGFRL